MGVVPCPGDDGQLPACFRRLPVEGSAHPWAGWQGARSPPRTGGRWGGGRPGHRRPMNRDAPHHPPGPGEDAWARSLALAKWALSLLGSVGR